LKKKAEKKNGQWKNPETRKGAKNETDPNVGEGGGEGDKGTEPGEKKNIGQRRHSLYEQRDLECETKVKSKGEKGIDNKTKKTGEMTSRTLETGKRCKGRKRRTSRPKKVVTRRKSKAPGSERSKNQGGDDFPGGVVGGGYEGNRKKKSTVLNLPRFQGWRRGRMDKLVKFRYHQPTKKKPKKG